MSLRRVARSLSIPVLVVAALTVGLAARDVRAEGEVFALVPAPEREVILHGFRSPGMGLEFREGPLGFNLSMYPTVVDKNGSGLERTTWFAKVGLTGYFLGVDTGSGRMSSLYASAALMQGLNNKYDVSRSVAEGTALVVDVGARWAAYKGLDFRLGVSVLVGLDGSVSVNPTPGISWAIPF